jgi:ATP-binding cassette subfamily B protein/subfamily B ATP-binding cassette protein MsbA
MRKLAFERAVRLPLHRVHALKSGGIASMLRDDAGGVGDLIFTMLYNPWRSLVQLVGTIIVLVVVDWRLVVGAFLLMPILWYTHYIWIRRIRPIYRDIRLTRQGIDARTTEVFGGMRIVRGFARERGEAGSFVGANHFMTRQEILVWWRARAVDIAWQIVIPLASAGVLLYGGSRVLEGSLTLGDVMMFSAYLLYMLGPLESLASTATQVQTHLAGFDRTLDLLDEPLEFAGAREGIALDRDQVRGAMTLSDVSFRYPGGSEDVIRDVSLEVNAGETVALVGASGAGKTTLCNLAARFFDPTSGTIRFDGIDLREIDIDSYRSLLGVVEQDVFLFDGTVGENIAYGRPDATPDEIEEAAHIANAAGFIDKMEHRYDTVIGERGVRLSGGQKQRIAIARAVLSDPRLLILDEATSNLDTESEQLIQASLGRLMQGRTSFVIAHRLSTIRHADRIVVIEDGRIVESGTHDELIAASGRYAELLEKQIAPPEAGVGAQG